MKNKEQLPLYGVGPIYGIGISAISILFMILSRKSVLSNKKGGFMNNKSKLTGADALLLLLYLDNQSVINGAVRLTKMMFLFENEIAPNMKNGEIDIEKLPKFFPYNYGPFSKDVYEQLGLFSKQ